MESSPPSHEPQIVSVVTVVKDDLTGFTHTLNSLSAQADTCFEWIVVDSSADKSEILAALKNGGVDFMYLWQKPSGIYPAMNSGAKEATGQFLYFLNAGDEFAGDHVLREVTDRLKQHSPVWAFGAVSFFDPNGKPLAESEWDYQTEFRNRFARGKFPAHQAVFVGKTQFEALGGFDERYKIAADYNLIAKISLMAKPYELKLTIAEFHQGGASTTSWRTAQSEFHRTRLEVYKPEGLDRIHETYFHARGFAHHMAANLRARINP